MPAIAVRRKPRNAEHSKKAGSVKTSWPLKESREAWLDRMRKAYTAEVCERMVRLNASLPVHGEP